MSNEVKHTAEPWAWHSQGDANEYCLITSSGDWVIAFRQNGQMMPSKQEANARRIVACVNACVGMDTGYLETYGLPVFAELISSLSQQRDQLMAAIVELRAAIRAGRYEDPSHDRIYQALIDSEAAIAAAKGGAA